MDMFQIGCISVAVIVLVVLLGTLFKCVKGDSDD
jgi:hypothetical protein